MPLVLVGVLINSVLIGALIYLSLDDSNFKESEEKLAIIKLDNIVKSIEYYNLIHSEYPDSLVQLKLEDPMELDIDFIQVGKNRSDVTFYYEKKSAKEYYLLSRGNDGKEFTKDDLFPTLIPSEKIGLIFPVKGEVKN